MARIDLLNLEPQIISKNMKGKYVLIYGQPKVGKTTLSSQFDKPLILAFEPGTNALNNAYVQPMRTWDDLKNVVRQLTKNEQLKEKFHSVVFDVIDIAYDLCEKSICDSEGVEQIKDIPYGAGYKMVDKEFESTLRDLSFAGYCLIFISHETEREQTRVNGEKYMQIVPSMAKRCAPIVNGLVDIIAYLKSIDKIDSSGERRCERNIYLVGDERFLAGSRFYPIAPKVEMSYEGFEKAVINAVEKTAERDGVTATNAMNPFSELDFDTLMGDAKALWKQIVQADKTEQACEILQAIFGKPTKFSEILPDDVSKLNQAIVEIKTIL